MIKYYTSLSVAILLVTCCTSGWAQDNLVHVKNIFQIESTDTTQGLWTLKKTDLHRINLVRMQGETKMHKHPDAEHTIFLVKGAMLAVVDGNTIELKDGDLLSIPAGVPHKYFVKGKKAIIMSMDAPYYNPDKTIMLE